MSPRTTASHLHHITLNVILREVYSTCREYLLSVDSVWSEYPLFSLHGGLVMFLSLIFTLIMFKSGDLG